MAQDQMTPAQQSMLLASEPDDVTGNEGAGVELRRARDYAVARALQRRGLGYVAGPGDALPGMYWNNAEGLVARSEIIASAWADDFDDHCDVTCQECGGDGGWNSCMEDCCAAIGGEDCCDDPRCWRTCPTCGGDGSVGL